jgi:hypothetical protein
MSLSFRENCSIIKGMCIIQNQKRNNRFNLALSNWTNAFSMHWKEKQKWNYWRCGKRYTMEQMNMYRARIPIRLTLLVNFQSGYCCNHLSYAHSSSATHFNDLHHICNIYWLTVIQWYWLVRHPFFTDVMKKFFDSFFGMWCWFGCC